MAAARATRAMDPGSSLLPNNRLGGLEDLA